MWPRSRAVDSTDSDYSLRVQSVATNVAGAAIILAVVKYFLTVKRETWEIKGGDVVSRSPTPNLPTLS
jgi:hypothetical protein